MSSKKELSSPNLSPLATAIAFAVAAPVASAETFTVVNTNASGSGSLAQAVKQANVTAGADTIEFDASVRGPIMFAAPLVVSDELTIDGGESANSFQIVTGDDETASYGIRVYDTSLTLSNITLTAAQATDTDEYASIITAFDSTLSVDGVDFHGNFHSKDANFTYSSAITGRDSDVTVSNSTFHDLDSENAAIYINNQESDHSLSVTASTFNNNEYGGVAVYSSFGDTTVTISDTLFTHDEKTGGEFADASGDAAIRVVTRGGTSATMISNSTVMNHYSDNGGGAIQLWSYNDATANLVIADSTFQDNATDEEGGALYTWALYADNNVSINNSSFINNYSDDFGGAIRAVQDESGSTWLTITDSTFTSNMSVDDGGAISIYSANEGTEAELAEPSVTVNLISSTFSDNYSAEYGGVVSLYAGNFAQATLNVSNSTMTDNAAADGASVIMSESAVYGTSMININSSTIVNNASYFAGGGTEAAVYIKDYASNSTHAQSSVTITNSVIADNTVYYVGNDLYVDATNNTTVTIANSLIKEPSVANVDVMEQLILDGAAASGNMIFADPMLSKLADNGGATWTMEPMDGSPLLNAGDDSFAADLTTDQNGNNRIYNDAIDIGAVEALSVGAAQVAAGEKVEGGPFGGISYLFALLGLGGLLRRINKR